MIIRKQRFGKSTQFEPDENIIPAPRDPALWPAFRERLLRWREETRRRLNYDDSLYRKPEFAWSASNYSCLFLMIYDEAFYDTKSGRYTAEPLLDDGLSEFGGYDSLVLWHAYPRIGLDDRNQFDFYCDMPGGFEDLQEYVMEVCDGIKDHWVRNTADRNDTRWEYTYHQRLCKYDVPSLAAAIDQIEVMCQQLAKTGFTRRAQAITWKVWRARRRR